MRASLFHLLHAATALGAIAAPTAAIAQHRDFELDLPARPLADALRTLARRTGQPILFREDEVRGVRGVALRGRYSVDAALAALLADTSLNVSRNSGGFLVVRRGAAPVIGAAAPAIADDIIVTGSRIATAQDQIASPTAVVDARRIDASGQTSVADYLINVPALRTTLTNQRTAQNVYGGAAVGANLLNLRDLGTERTLVLVNGRRHVATQAGSQAVDINTIPRDLIERVDIVTGGQSAVYGSDGVSGVVNFILKDDFDGITARAQSSLTTYGDGGKYLISVTAGRNFAEGRGNVTLAYEYGQDAAVYSPARPRYSAANDVRFWANPDNPVNAAGYTGSLNNGIPQYLPLKNLRYMDTSAGGVIDVDQDFSYDYIMGANGQALVYDKGTMVDYAYYGGNGYPMSSYVANLTPAQRRHIVNATAHFDLSDKVTLYAEGKFARTRSYSTYNATFDDYLLIEADNPYIPASLGTVSADGLLMSRWNFDMGRLASDVTRNVMRGVFGVKGELGDHAGFDMSYVHGRTKVRQYFANNQYSDRFLAAVDVVRDASGNITCRVNVEADWTPNQPYQYMRAVSAPLSFKPGECVPLNLFGEGSPSQAAIDWIRAPSSYYTTLQQDVATASITGDLGALFTLPGGPVGFAIGGEYRRESSKITADAIFSSGNSFVRAPGLTHGSFDVKEGFAELRAPVLKDVAFAHSLTFGAAVRLSDYSTAGRTDAWNIDGSYAPIRGVTFNATLSRAVRAPSITELYRASTTTSDIMYDPCAANQQGLGTQYRAANCAALLSSLGVTSPSTFAPGGATFVQGTEGGNTGLKPEIGRTWTAGVLLQPAFVPGLSLRADWYDIRIDGAINSVSFEETANLCVDSPTLDNPYCAAITRQSGSGGVRTAGTITGYTVGPQNVAQFGTSGLDVALSYALQTATIGRFDLLVQGNYLHSLYSYASISSERTNTRGEINSPIWSAQTTLGWSSGPVQVNYGLAWNAHTTRFTNQEITANPSITSAEYFYIKPKWQHDLSATVTIDDHLELTAGASNLFNQQPDIGDNDYPVSAIGRTLFVSARMKTGRL